MRFDVLTLFPELFGPFRTTGVLGRAVDSGLVDIVTHDLREWAGNRWRQVDDEPYGGGAGMVIQAPPVLAAIREVTAGDAAWRTVMLSPRGRPFDEQCARELAVEPRVLLVCGRYEGIDERVVDILEPDELSIGDVVLGGGEVAAMVVIEAVSRLLPGVVGDPESVVADSFADGLLDHPAYTRPPEVEGHEVPEVLRSGNHEAVRRWRLERAVAATVTRRPDLIKRHWDRYTHEVRELVRRLGGAPDGDADVGHPREAT
jgi:tRNA (guanine37-N1)-methyltransferase